MKNALHRMSSKCRRESTIRHQQVHVNLETKKNIASANSICSKRRYINKLAVRPIIQKVARLLHKELLPEKILHEMEQNEQARARTTQILLIRLFVYIDIQSKLVESHNNSVKVKINNQRSQTTNAPVRTIVWYTQSIELITSQTFPYHPHSPNIQSSPNEPLQV